MILGIECTAHTFGIALVNQGKILSNERDMYVTESGGIIPTESAKHHKEVANKIYNQALEKANIKESQIKAIAISKAQRPTPSILSGLD